MNQWFGDDMMPWATLPIQEAGQQSSGELGRIIGHLYDGPWQLIQLRGAPLSTEDINRGDVDFLASRDSVERLFQSAFEWVRSGACHVIIQARSRDKVSFQVISLDGRDRLRLDLWITLRQVAGGKRYLRYKDCAAAVERRQGAIHRLPLRAEIGLYIDHLSAKRKDLGSQRVQQRLAGYAAACVAANERLLAEALSTIAGKRQLTPEALAAGSDALRDFGLSGRTESWGERSRRATAELIEASLAPPRRCHCIAITGCDGAGKSSLARNIARINPEIRGVLVGKRLYRNSILYKTAATVIRPLLLQPREKFDDTLAPAIYARASLALELRRWSWRKGIRLIDRSLIDFLIVNRKSDLPRLHGSRRLADVIGRRIPCIHLIVPTQRLMARKQEMTPAGHEIYDRLVFECLSRRNPTSYAMFFNGGGLELSTAAANRLIGHLGRP